MKLNEIKMYRRFQPGLFFVGGKEEDAREPVPFYFKGNSSLIKINNCLICPLYNECTAELFGDSISFVSACS